MPIAPGTFGSAVGFLAVLALKPADPVLLIIFLVSFFIGLLASNTAEKTLGKDSTHIVIDEFAGYLLAALFIPKNIGFLAAVFILFRIFDILKPPPIRKIERSFSGGAGIMLDDVFAAVYTNICIQIWIYIF